MRRNSASDGPRTYSLTASLLVGVVSTIIIETVLLLLYNASLWWHPSDRSWEPPPVSLRVSDRTQ